ncbi:hypothetical protein [Simplicispira psychrophila]|uniref:hypothetical protein n=1 Tax=Simplicispira psychrophila TaxID=80882 RepID=UPI0012EBCD1E|nr:hypothetical protein [Simplicispira psychrophila]
MIKIARVFLLTLTLFCTSAMAINPKAGTWWNPQESGSGYSFDGSGTTLAMLAYVYDKSGQATWSLATGELTNNGANWSANLENYIGGPCMGCAFRPNQATGSTGIVSVVFTSDTTGIMTMPNGSKTAIQAFFAAGSTIGGRDDAAGQGFGGLPMQWGDTYMEKIETSASQGFCTAKMTFKNTASSPRTPFLSFDVTTNGINVGQIIFNFQSLGGGQTASIFGAATGVAPNCAGLSLHFNESASKVFAQ